MPRKRDPNSEWPPVAVEIRNRAKTASTKGEMSQNELSRTIGWSSTATQDFFSENRYPSLDLVIDVGKAFGYKLRWETPSYYRRLALAALCLVLATLLISGVVASALMPEPASTHSVWASQFGQEPFGFITGEKNKRDIRQDTIEVEAPSPEFIALGNLDVRDEIILKITIKPNIRSNGMFGLFFNGKKQNGKTTLNAIHIQNSRGGSPRLKWNFMTMAGQEFEKMHTKYSRQIPRSENSEYKFEITVRCGRIDKIVIANCSRIKESMQILAQPTSD